MNANVFQCYEEQSDTRQFIKTKEALDAYVKKNLKYNNEDLASLFADEMTLPELDMPDELPEGSTPRMETRLWESELQEFVKRRKCFRGNLVAVQAVVLGQCIG
jgi:5'-deoxynucleotidase YfbR-like HD superfamily hydrolase